MLTHRKQRPGYVITLEDIVHPNPCYDRLAQQIEEAEDTRILAELKNTYLREEV